MQGRPRQEIKALKNLAVKLFFFTDDDCIAPPDWMETLIGGFKRHPEVSGVGGWIGASKEALSKNAIARYFEQLQRNYEVISNYPMRCFSVSAINTANIAYKKEVLESVGGFNKKFYWPGSEDTDLAFRIMLSNRYILYIPFIVVDSKDMDFLSFIKMCFKRGANGHLLRVMNRDILEKLKPGFVENYGSITDFILRLLVGEEKILTFLHWLSINAGIRYMKNGLSKGDNPILAEPKAKISDN